MFLAGYIMNSEVGQKVYKKQFNLAISELLYLDVSIILLIQFSKILLKVYNQSFNTFVVLF